MSQTTMNQIAITMGDAAGVGPEIILKTMKNYPEYQKNCIVYGAADVLDYYNRAQKYDLEIHRIADPRKRQADGVNVIDPFPIRMNEFTVGQLSAKCGDGSAE